MARLLTCLPLAALLLITFAPAEPPKPIDFKADSESVPNPADLPPEVLALLSADKEDFPNGAPPNLRCRENEGFAPTDPQQQILCSKLSLGPKHSTDILVIGVGSLRGSHVVPFWIFHQNRGNATLLFKTRSDTLSILPTNSNGYHDIESTWMTKAGTLDHATQYHFDGHTYVEAPEAGKQ